MPASSSAVWRTDVAHRRSAIFAPHSPAIHCRERLSVGRHWRICEHPPGKGGAHCHRRSCTLNAQITGGDGFQSTAEGQRARRGAIARRARARCRWRDRRRQAGCQAPGRQPGRHVCRAERADEAGNSRRAAAAAGTAKAANGSATGASRRTAASGGVATAASCRTTASSQTTTATAGRCGAGAQCRTPGPEAGPALANTPVRVILA